MKIGSFIVRLSALRRLGHFHIISTSNRLYNKRTTPELISILSSLFSANYNESNRKKTITETYRIAKQQLHFAAACRMSVDGPSHTFRRSSLNSLSLYPDERLPFKFHPSFRLAVCQCTLHTHITHSEQMGWFDRFIRHMPYMARSGTRMQTPLPLPSCPTQWILINFSCHFPSLHTEMKMHNGLTGSDNST